MDRALLALLALALTACASIGRAPVGRDLLDQPYVADAQQRQRGDLYVPQGLGPWPAVVVIHGGAWVRGERDDMEKFASRLVKAGYAVYNIDYRLAPAARFPAQLDDVRDALRWLHTHASEHAIDPERIAIMGYSAGAHLALMLGLTQSDEHPAVRAVIAGAAPSDLRGYNNSPVTRALIGGGAEDYPVPYAYASPITHVSPDDPPVLLYHGKQDRLVEVGQSERLYAALQAAGVRSELLIPPWGGHITTFLFDRETFTAAIDFLDENLKTVGARN